MSRETGGAIHAAILASSASTFVDDQQLDISTRAVELFVTGERADCIGLLRSLGSDEMREWSSKHDETASYPPSTGDRIQSGKPLPKFHLSTQRLVISGMQPWMCLFCSS